MPSSNSSSMDIPRDSVTHQACGVRAIASDTPSWNGTTTGSVRSAETHVALRLRAANRLENPERD